MAKKGRLVWVGGGDGHDLYQCMRCGGKVSVQKQCGKPVRPERCPHCASVRPSVGSNG